MRTRRRQVQGIEVADQMAVHAVGADQHQGADGLARCPESLLAADLDALLLGLAADLAADLVLFAAPVGAERVEQVAVPRYAVFLMLPGWAVRLGEHRVLALLQIPEEGAPVGGDRPWIFLKTLVQIFNVSSVSAMEKRGYRKRLV